MDEKPAVDDIHCAGCLVKERRITQLEADSEMLVLMYEANPERFVGLTMEIDEHPEDYGRACLCKLCQSYGD